MKASSPNLDRAHNILSSSIGADAHVDTLQRLLVDGVDLDAALSEGHVDYPRLLSGKVSLLVCALWTPTYYPREAAFARTIDLLAAARRFCAKSKHFKIAASVSAANKIIRDGSIAMVLSLEGCDALGRNLNLLERFREEGVSSIGLTHVSANDLSGSSTATSIHGGLSTLGRSAVIEMNRLGVLIDVSHASDEAVSDVLDVSTQPVVASHSCCRSLCESPRNLPDALIAAIASRGGVICIAAHAGFLHPEDIREITVPTIPEETKKDREALDERLRTEHIAALQAKDYRYATLEDLADHIEHAVRVAGIGHVALGSGVAGGNRGTTYHPGPNARIWLSEGKHTATLDRGVRGTGFGQIF